MNRIDLAQAKAIIEAAFAKGAELKTNPLAVAVLDPGGHLIAYERQDGASLGRFQIATGKAAGALALGISSRRVEEIGLARPAFFAGLTVVAPDGIIGAAGGVIVVRDGEPIGAVGVSGDTSDNDEAAALAGIAAAGLTAQ